MFDKKVCGQSCPKLVAPPDNMHSLGEMPVNIGIRVFQPSHLFYVHVLGLGVNSNMMPGMLASLAVFTGG